MHTLDRSLVLLSLLFQDSTAASALLLLEASLHLLSLVRLDVFLLDIQTDFSHSMSFAPLLSTFQIEVIL